MRQRTKLGFFTLIVLIVCTLWGINYYRNAAYLTVNWSNLTKVEIYDVFDTRKLIASATSSGQNLSLRKGSYVIHYIGSDHYADSYDTITLSEREQSLTYKPGYSEAYLDELRKAEMPAITNLLTARYPAIKAYTVQPGKLYDTGQWYGTTLVYHGPDILNADKLHIILHKVDGQWKISAQPTINISALEHPNIPRGILKDVNSQY